MYKILLLIISTLILTACNGKGIYNSSADHNASHSHSHQSGTNMRDGDPEKAVSSHSAKIMRNEAAASSAISRAANDLN